MNLLLISIDSLRLDCVSRTNPAIHTPCFDQLTRNFWFCERLFSPSSATRPVHASLFTGLYPFEHGVLGQGSPRMRSGLSHLFELFDQKDYATRGYSEAQVIFEGLDFAPWIQQFSRNPARQLGAFLSHPTPKCLFLHYWSTHTPYGAEDNRAFGETARLLFSGRQHIVRQRYLHAVEKVFEKKLAPLLAQLDLSQWCVLIFGDHGESWTMEEPYHGTTLKNSVLRVPLYVHLPRLKAQVPTRPLLSIIDLFPTLVNLFELNLTYKGYGRDIRQNTCFPYHLAQIHPLPGKDDLTGEAAQEQILGGYYAGPRWAVFDEQRKFTFEEGRGKGRLEHTLTEEMLDDPSMAAHYKEVYTRMQADSAYVHLPIEPSLPTRENLLHQRLRDLGYME